jgi:hypothetical protein
MAQPAPDPPHSFGAGVMTALSRPLAWALQGVLYALFVGSLALFSQWPVYRHLDDDQALIKLSIVHQGERLAACVEQTAEELARLPPTMRAPSRCPRERAPLAVEVDVDGHPLLRQTAQPGGLSRDGSASMYQRRVVAAGEHHVTVRLRDSPRSEGFDYHGEATVTLRPAQILLIDFDSEARVVTLR